MWLFMLFALVIIEMVTETRKENARQARVDRVLKQTGAKPEDYLPRKFDSDKWLKDFYARNPWMDPSSPQYIKSSSERNKDNNSGKQ